MMGIFGKKNKYKDLTQQPMLPAQQPQQQVVQQQYPPNFVTEDEYQRRFKQQLPQLQPLQQQYDPYKEVLVKIAEHLSKLNEYIIAEFRRIG